MKKKNYNNEERPTASMGWVLLGLVFGILGLIIALITDKGDGRVKKTLGGCLISLLITVVCIFIIVQLALLGPAVGNIFSNIISSLEPTVALTP